MQIKEKIVHICLTALYTDNWSYQEQKLTKYHKRLGYDVVAITSHWVNNEKGEIVWDDRFNYINDDGVNVYRLTMKGKEYFYKRLKRFNNLYETIEKEKPNIIFVHGISVLDIDLVVKYVKKHPEVMLYVDNHADFSNSATNWVSKNILHKMIWKHYAKMLLPYVKKFYGVMPSRQSFLTEMYNIPKEKTELLVLGVDDDEIDAALSTDNRKAVREKYGIAEDDILIITGGKIDIPKRQTITLMETVNKMDNPKVKLIVFGSVVDELKAAVDKQCSDKCQYIGWIDSKETLNYYGASDLVVFPGRHSVFWEQVVGIGKPMICKYWEGTTHVDLGGNVKFLYEDTVDEMKKVISSVLNDPKEYDHMKRVAEEKGRKIFAYSQIAKRSLGILD